MNGCEASGKREEKPMEVEYLTYYHLIIEEARRGHFLGSFAMFRILCCVEKMTQSPSEWDTSP